MQILRGLAALAVLIYHSSLVLRGKLGIDLFPDAVLGASGVDLFFVISGFIIVHSSDRLFGCGSAPLIFLTRRIIRIVPLYWAATAIMVVHGLVSGMHSVDLSWQNVLASLFFVPYPRPSGIMLPAVTVGWTLNYEMFFYLVFAAAILLPRRRAVFAAGVALTLLTIAAALRPISSRPVSFLLDPIILEFCLGMAIALAHREGAHLPRLPAIMLAFAAALTFVLSAMWSDTVAWRTAVWGLPAAMLLAIVTLCTSGKKHEQPSRLVRAFEILGDASYSLYLLHWIVLLGMARLIPHVFDPPSAPWICVALLLVAPIATAILCYFGFERPITRSLQSRLAILLAASNAGVQDRQEVTARRSDLAVGPALDGSERKA